MADKRIKFILLILILIFAFVIESAIVSAGNSGVVYAYSSTESVPTSIGSLTLSDYSTRTDGYVFDGNVLDKLYALITGNSSATYDDAKNAVSLSQSETYGTANNSLSYADTQSSSINFSQINNGTAITLEFGGYTWNVVYLTTNTNSNNGGNAGDLIATLWMSETVKTDSGSNLLCQFSDFSSTATNGNYSSCEYSVSKIRVQTLNGGSADYIDTEYAKNTTETNEVTAEARAANQFAKFTMSNSALTVANKNSSNGNLSLIDYLATPSQVNYQQKENWPWSWGNTSNGTPYLQPNEAWGGATINGIQTEGPDQSLRHYATSATYRTGGWYTNNNSATTNNMLNVIDNVNYYNWIDDYLWLPGMTEIGFKRDGSSTFSNDATYGASLWGIPNDGTNNKANYYIHDIVKSNGGYWTRSANATNASNAYTIVSTGGMLTYATNYANGWAIRPALHLNLTKANENLVREYDTPTDISTVYNGETQRIDQDHLQPSWYDSEKMTLEYTDSKNYIDVGSYEVTVTLNRNVTDNFGVFKDGSTTKKVNIIITPRILTPLLWRWNSAINQPEYTFEENSIFQRDIDAGTAPIFGFSFTNVETNQVTNDWPNTYGTYRIALRITNSTVCKNYALATGITPLEQSLKRRVNFDEDNDTISWLANGATVTETSLPYIPDGYEIRIGSYMGTSSTLADRGLSLGGIYLEGSSGTEQSLTVTAVRSYTIIAHIVNLNDDYYEFSYDFTLSLTITRAKYDLTNISWNYVERNFIYDGTHKIVTLTGLQQYSGLLSVDEYLDNDFINVNALGYTASFTHFVNSDSNYETPVSTNPDSYIYNGDGDFPWSYDWRIIPFEISTENWQRDAWDYNGVAGVKPRLVDDYNGVVDYEFYEESNGSYVLIPFENITITQGVVKRYQVKAILADPNSLNYTLGMQNNPYSFTLGKNMTVITATVSGLSHIFDGTPKFATASYAGFSLSDFVMSYVDENGQTTDDPVHAGNYKVIITLSDAKAEDYLLSESEFDFIIEKASIDLSNLHWNYDSENPFQYKREGGEIASYNVELLGWEDGNAIHDYVKSLLQYAGNTEASTVSSVSRPYTATFDFVGLVESDFEDFTLPDELQSKSLAWHIKKRVIQKPAYDGENIIFSNEDIDLLELFGISGDWAEYFTITARYNNEPTTSYFAKNIGVYTFVCNFLPGINDDNDNVSWDDGDTFFATASVTIDPRIINVTGWSNERIPSPVVEDSANLDFINRVYTDSEGNVVSRTDINNTFNTSFRVTISSSFGDNVIIRTDAGVDDYKEFSTPADPNNPPTPVAKPTIENAVLQYTSYPVTFVLNGYDDSYMTMSGGLTYTDEGEYQLIIRFRDGANYCWDDGSRDPIVFTLTVFNDPDNPYIPPEQGNGNGFLDKIKDFFNSLIEKHFPLWQVITMAVSALLALIFMIKAIQYGNRAKKAKGEIKKLSARTYATLLPIFASDIVALGLSNQIWSIMAFAFVGLALLMFVIALITRHSWKKAMRAKEEAFNNPNGIAMQNGAGMQNMGQVAMQGGVVQGGMIQPMGMMQGGMMYGEANIEEILRRHDEERRRDEEERRRQDEERHREEMAALREEQTKRDEAMKIMLAGMMGRQQGDEDFAYASMDDTDLLVQKVIAGLLPMVQQMIPEPTAYLTAPADTSQDIKELTAQISDLKEQLASIPADRAEAVIMPDNSEEIRILEEKHAAEMQELSAQVASMQQQIDTMSAMSVDELDDNDFEDEEEWDSILDEDDDDDFLEAVIVDEDGTVRKASPNFRMRLKQSSDKNREWYAAIKNLFCSQKGITYRVYKRVEKIRYQGQVIAVIGIAKRSIKLWLALKPFEYDARRYRHKDVSDKPRFVDVPLYVRIGSDRALTRAQELILALFQEQATEPRKRYTDRDIQELIFTLKYNKLLTKQNKGLLREVMHVHDCDVLDNETAEKCIESKNVEYIDDSVIETVKLDDIDRHFQDGNRVTLEKLRKAGLVSAECTGYNVTAGQRLTKPLIIVANDFTMEAVKMIALTGGRVIKLAQVVKQR